MQTVTLMRAAPHFGTALLLALVVVLPPKYLTAYVVILSFAAAIWALVCRRALLLRPSVLAILVPLLLAAVFSLFGTLPITQQSDIQLEFLKYGVYAAAFLLGFLVLGHEERIKAFTVCVTALIAAFFVATAFASESKFSVNQSWFLYPPDQNNSTSILAPLSAVILTFRPRWLKVSLLLLLFLLFTFAESRLGVMIVVAVAIIDLILDWRSAVAVLAPALLVAGLLSLSPVGAQATVMAAISNFESAAAAAVPSSFSPRSPADPQQAGTGIQPAPGTQAHQNTQAILNIPAGQSTKPEVPKTRMIEFGTVSDNLRIKIYARALNIAAEVFPNPIGLGDAKVVTLLNTPSIDGRNTFQHAHNFFLQGYLAYGLLATASMVAAAIAIAVVAIRRRNWYSLGALVLVGAFGMIEALTSDVRVLTILMIFIGSSVGTSLRSGGTQLETSSQP